MKFSIKQKVLHDLISKGGIAALSEVDFSDNNVGLLASCIKISVDKDISVESSSVMMSAICSIPATPENSVNVMEKGSCVLPAKEFFQWLRTQGTDATITIEIKLLEHPEFIDPVSDVEERVQKITVKKIALAKFVAKDSAKTGSKWDLDSFDFEQFPHIPYDKLGTKIFDIIPNALQLGYDKISFAALPVDVKHILDNISIQSYENNVYFSTTDSNRCVIYKMDMITDANIESQLLIPCKIIKDILPILDSKEKISFYINKEAKKIFINQASLTIRINNFEDEIVNKFPKVLELNKYEYVKLVSISKSGLKKALSVASMVNKIAALFTFKKEDSSLLLKTVAMDGKYKPILTKVDVLELIKDYKAVWGVTHFSDVLKVLQSDTINISVPSNDKSVKITGDNDKDFMYFTLTIKNKKYLEE